jgi:DNA-binding response OmpR family regulator
MDKVKLLFVEDDASFAFVIKGSLELSGLYQVYTASDGKEGLDAYDTFQPDVIVSDIEMPVLNGMEMIRKIRQKDQYTPILFATGRTNAQDVLDGYKLNVDNFIKKPFLPEELSAHIQAILKRTRNALAIFNQKELITMGEYVFNVDRQLLQWKNEIFKLTNRETQVLWKLYEQKGELVKRENLLEELWGINDFFTSRSLDVFIASLRKYLSNDPKIFIETVRGKGLKLIITHSDGK